VIQIDLNVCVYDGPTMALRGIGPVTVVRCRKVTLLDKLPVAPHDDGGAGLASDLPCPLACAKKRGGDGTHVGVREFRDGKFGFGSGHDAFVPSSFSMGHVPPLSNMVRRFSRAVRCQLLDSRTRGSASARGQTTDHIQCTGLTAVETCVAPRGRSVRTSVG